MIRLRNALVLGLVVGTVGLALRLTDIGLRLEESLSLGWLFRVRGPVAPPPDVAVVSIDKSSAQQAGLDTREWPPPRHIHAGIVRSLASRGVSVIAMDIVFDGHRSDADDRDLAEAIARSGIVVLAQDFDRLKVVGSDIEVEQLLSPIELLQESAIGLAPFPLPDGPVIRYFWPFFPTTRGELPTLPTVALQVHMLRNLDQLRAVAERAGGPDLRGLPSRIKSAAESRQLMMSLREALKNNRDLAMRTIALLDKDEAGARSPAARAALAGLIRLYAGTGRSYLNFYGPAGTIRTLPFHRVLDDSDTSLNLAGTVVFVGEGASDFVSSASQQDTYRTAYSTSDGIDISGAEIGATAVANLLTGRVLEPVGPFALAALLGSFALAIALAARLLPGGYGAVTSAVLAVAYFQAALFLFARHSIWVPVAIPLLVQLPVALFAGLFARYRDVRRFVPVEMHPSARQRQFIGVCLTTDVSGYTALTSRLTPPVLGRLLDAYYDMIRRIVKARGGTVWGRAGDSTLSVWNVQPSRIGRTVSWLRRTPTEASVRARACLAAVELRDAIEHFNAARPDTHQLPTRIGLDAGEVGFGPIADELQAVGNPVNVASRIQELNKRLSTRVLASGRVVASLDGFLLRRLGEFRLPGVSAGLAIFEIVAPVERATEAERRLCDLFAKALQLYETERWSEAEALFRQLGSTFVQDGPTEYYRELCARASTAATPPNLDQSQTTARQQPL